MKQSSPSKRAQRWPDYAAIWRWHFYAGLFCLPFFCWLAITGSLYVFRPDIERLLDRPYESLTLNAAPALPSVEAKAALDALPGSRFSHYEPPATTTGAAQVVVAKGGELYRVYVHPTTLKPMKIERDDHRIMDVIAHLHGNLLIGPRGSMIVELAGSWGVIMIITGLCLWFPRGTTKLAGLLYPRLSQRGRLFWRDLHAVMGLWICLVTLFLLLSGLPWSSNWGNYFTWVRNHWNATSGMPDWSLGGGEEPVPQFKISASESMASMPGMQNTMRTANLAKAAIGRAEMAAMAPPAVVNSQPPIDLTGLDNVLPVALNLAVPRPMWILPPSPDNPYWIASSRNQDRPLRVSYAITASGEIVGRKGFQDDDAINRAINVAIAAHEGHLFGRPNQIILLVNAAGVLLVSISAAVMWWRRKPSHALGAPISKASPSMFALLAISLVALCLTVLLPLFGLSLIVVLALDRWLLPIAPSFQRWLGLSIRSKNANGEAS